MRVQSFVTVATIICALSLACRPQSVIPNRENEDREGENISRLRADWFNGQRADANGKVPGALRTRALRQLDAMLQTQRANKNLRTASRLSSQITSNIWHTIGPQPLTLKGFPNFPLSGRVDAIAVDPRDANVVYAGSDSGGVWKTLDGGHSWKPLTDDQPSLLTGAMALDPNNPDTIWVGTGGIDDGGGEGYYGVGFLESTDGGASWVNLTGPWGNPSDTLFTAHITSVAVQPGDSNVLLATVGSNVSSAPSGVYRSTDAAKTWKLVLQGETSYSAVFDPNNGQVAYACTAAPPSFREAIYKSTDGGITWTDISSATIVSNRLEIRVAPSQSSTIYAFGGGFWKSSDAGGHWRSFSEPAQEIPFRTALAVSPVNPDLVFIGGFEPFRSQDGGQTWDPVASFHADYHAFAFSSDGQKIYIGNDGGIFSNGSPAAADLSNVNPNWENLNATLQTDLIYPGMSVDDSNPNVALAGSQDNGSLVYDGGLSWRSVVGGDGGYTALGTPGLAYLTTTPLPGHSRSDLLRSSGSSFTPADNGIPQSGELSLWIAPLVADPSNRNRLYYGASHVYQTSDGAQNWTAISPAFSNEISTIAVAPSDPNYVYAGLWTGVIEISTNATSGTGATWVQSGGALPRHLSAIAVDPKNPHIAFATFSGFSGFSGQVPGHVFETTDAGASWKDITGNLPNAPTSDIAIDADQPGTMYVATDVGVFATSDSGNSWEPLVDGLPRAVVTGVKLIRGSRILRASTYGRGVWDLQLPPAQSTPVPDFALTISPQNVTLSRGSSSPLRVSIQSLNGFTGNVKLACTVPSSLASVTCIVAPDTIAGGGTATVTITSSGQTATVNRSLGTTTALALIPFACVFLLRFDKRLRCANKRNTALFAIVLAVAIGSIALGCGGTRNASTPPAGGAAPPSTASPITGTIVIQGTTGTQTHAINVSLTIT